MFITIGNSTNKIEDISTICHANCIDSADNSYDIIIILRNNARIRVRFYNKEMRDNTMHNVQLQLPTTSVADNVNYQE